jgi:hypothetical protein
VLQGLRSQVSHGHGPFIPAVECSQLQDAAGFTSVSLPQGTGDIRGTSHPYNAAESTGMNWATLDPELIPSNQPPNLSFARSTDHQIKTSWSIENCATSILANTNPAFSTLPAKPDFGFDITAADSPIAISVTPQTRFRRLPVNSNLISGPQLDEAGKERRSPPNPFRDKYQCTYCERRFAEEGYRTHHEKQKHDSQYTFTCLHDDCIGGRQYTSKKEGLDKHRRSAHTECVNTDCQKCFVGQQVMIRPPKKAAACGVCGTIFRNRKTLLTDRAEHIRGHYSRMNKDAKFLYFWKQSHWKKSNIVKAFIREPEVHRYWRAWKAVMANDTPGFKFDLNWDNCNDEAWEHFIYLAEFGGAEYTTAYFSSAHARAIVEMAYSLAERSPREHAQSSPISSKTHSRSSSVADPISDPTFHSEISSRHTPLVTSYDTSPTYNDNGLALRQVENANKNLGPSPSNPQSHKRAISSPQVADQPKRVNIDPTNHIGAPRSPPSQSTNPPQWQTVAQGDMIDLQSGTDFMDLSDHESGHRNRNRGIEVEMAGNNSGSRNIAGKSEPKKSQKNSLRKKLSRKKLNP